MVELISLLLDITTIIKDLKSGLIFPHTYHISQYKGVLEFSYPLLVLLIDAFYIA